MGGAKPDRSFKIVAHPHAETGKSAFLRKFLQQREMRRRLFVQGGNAHQSDDREFQRVTAVRNKTGHAGGSDT